MRTNRRTNAIPGRALTGSLAVALALTGAACRAAEQGASSGEVAVAARPEVSTPQAVEQLSGTFGSPFALAAAILDGIRAGDYEQLLQYRVDEAEWVHIVWPELPSSLPERGISWDYAWRDLDQKSRNAVRQTIARHEGHGYRLLRVEFAEQTTDYGDYKVHRDARCVVETGDGRIVSLDLFGSVIERRGRFKAFSYVVD